MASTVLGFTVGIDDEDDIAAPIIAPKTISDKADMMTLASRTPTIEASMDFKKLLFFITCKFKKWINNFSDSVQKYAAQM
jgi:hypothetical protein